MKKRFYFICRRCNRRKATSQEAACKPGVCMTCYKRDADADEREAE